MKYSHRLFVLAKVVFIMFLILFPQSELSAAQDNSKVKNSDAMPTSIISIDSKYAILVEKSSQSLFFYQREGDDISLVKKYRCSTGKVHGDKLKSGDRKTPEGIYYINWEYKDKELPSRYGVMAFALDFPNYLDRIQDKGGSGIWIHGLDRPLLPYDSKGCIALANDDIREIDSYIEPFYTPVIIEQNITFSTSQETEREKAEVTGLLTTWKDSWEKKDLEQYLQCYSHERFKPDRRKWNIWTQHKRSLNNRYKFIDVEIKKINILKHDETFTVSFLQDYESDRFRSQGLKKLFIAKNSDVLKIVGEDWIKATEFVSVNSDVAISKKRELSRFLNRWITAWENKKIDEYMDCYSREFNSQNKGWNQWKKFKSDINNNNSIIMVSVKKQKIIIDDDRATVTFIQKYVSDSYTDYGLKNLKLCKERGAWKITAEGWEPI